MILPAGEGLFLTDCFCLRGTPYVGGSLFVEDVGGGRLLVTASPSCTDDDGNKVVGHIRGLPSDHAGLLCFKPFSFNRDGASYLGTEWMGAFLRELCLAPAHWHATPAKEVPRKEGERKASDDDAGREFLEEFIRTARHRR